MALVPLAELESTVTKPRRMRKPTARVVRKDTIALVLLLRRPVARHFGAAAAYALWFLPLARLILPPVTLPGWMRPALSDTAPVADTAATAALVVIGRWPTRSWPSLTRRPPRAWRTFASSKRLRAGEGNS